MVYKQNTPTLNSFSVNHLVKPVFLIGFMGAGKTSTARRLARVCHVASVDMDTYIERREGKNIKDIFDEIGETGFRRLESEVLNELANADPLIISCGGGVILSEDNRLILKEKGFVVYLRVSAGEAANRISDLSSRPLFTNLESAERIIASREPFYEEVADAIIDTSAKNVYQITKELKSILQREDILCQA